MSEPDHHADLIRPMWNREMDEPLALIRQMAERLIASANAIGVTLEITLVPGPGPLAMGNHVSEVHVWPARSRPGRQP